MCPQRSTASVCPRACGMCPPLGCRRGSAAGWHWPRSWCAALSLWLLDEPHAGLDSEGRGIVGSIVTAAAAAGAVVMLASHEPGSADDLATRTVTMAGGTVSADEA